MNLDRQKTEMQETGNVMIGGLSVAQIVEIVSDLGLDPHSTFVSSGGDLWVDQSGMFASKETVQPDGTVVDALGNVVGINQPAASQQRWYVHCGCDHHGDHLGCDTSCKAYGGNCRHPLGVEITAATEQEADSHVHSPACEKA